MADKESLRAALYIRVSTEEQALDGQSADAQAETLKQYCIAQFADKHGFSQKRKPCFFMKWNTF